MPKQSSKKSVVLSVRVPAEIADALSDLSEAFGITRNALATQILTMGFKVADDLAKEVTDKEVISHGQ